MPGGALGLLPRLVQRPEFQPPLCYRCNTAFQVGPRFSGLRRVPALRLESGAAGVYKRECPSSRNRLRLRLLRPRLPCQGMRLDLYPPSRRSLPGTRRSESRAGWSASNFFCG